MQLWIKASLGSHGDVGNQHYPCRSAVVPQGLIPPLPLKASKCSHIPVKFPFIVLYFATSPALTPFPFLSFAFLIHSSHHPALSLPSGIHLHLRVSFFRCLHHSPQLSLQAPSCINIAHPFNSGTVNTFPILLLTRSNSKQPKLSSPTTPITQFLKLVFCLIAPAVPIYTIAIKPNSLSVRDLNMLSSMYNSNPRSISETKATTTLKDVCGAIFLLRKSKAKPTPNWTLMISRSLTGALTWESGKYS